jgi:hypothetical protein
MLIAKNTYKFFNSFHLNTILTIALIIVSFLIAWVGSGWGGVFRAGFLKISIHKIINLEIALWMLLILRLMLFAKPKIPLNKTKVIKKNGFLRYSGYFLILGLLFLLLKSTLNEYFIAEDFLIIENAKKGFYNSVLLMPQLAQTYHLFRPFTFLSWFLDLKNFGYNSIGWHLTGFLLHSVNILIVILISEELLKNRTYALLAGLFFAVSGIHHEVVNYIDTRADLMCGLFYFSSLYSFIIFRKSEKRHNFFISLFLFLFALLSKETAISLPIVLITTEIVLSSDYKAFLKNLSFHFYYLLILVLYLFTRFFIYGTINPGSAIGGASKFMISSIPNYIKGAFLGFFAPMFFPVNWYAVDYFNFHWVHYLAFINSIILFLLIIFNSKKFLYDRVLVFSIIFIIVTTSILFDVWELPKSLHAARYYYVISFGFFLLMIRLCFEGNIKRIWFILNLVGLIIVFFCNLAFSYINNLAWKEATQVIPQICRQTKNFIPDSPTKKHSVFYYGFPDHVAGIIIYTWEPQLMRSILPHFYINTPDAMIVKPHDASFSLSKLDLNKSIILKWDQKNRRLADLTEVIRKKIHDPRKSNHEPVHSTIALSDIELWGKNMQITEIEKKRFEISGTDAFFFSEPLNIPASSFPYLQVKMKIQPKEMKYYSGFYVARLYWKTDKSGDFNDSNFVEIWLNPKNEYTLYDFHFINIDQILNGENITQLKLQPAYFPCSIDIEYLKLVTNVTIK